MWKSSKFLNCLTKVCVVQDFEARTKSIEVLCNLTLYPWNHKILASYKCSLSKIFGIYTDHARQIQSSGPILP